MNKIRGFTLVEIMIVVAIIAILAAIAIPQMIESRKMSRLNRCMSNLKIIEYAKEQMQLQRALSSGAVYATAVIVPFIKDGAIPACPSGGTYNTAPLQTAANCTYHGAISNPTALSALTSD